MRTKLYLWSLTSSSGGYINGRNSANLELSASPAYGVYISQLIRYARASSNYSDFLKRHLHLRNRLLDQGYENSANLELLIDKTSSIYLYVKLKALAS
jgi:hypothetical protein